MGWEWRAGAPGPGLLLLAGDPRPSSRPSSLRGRGDPTTLESEAVWGAPGPKGTWRCQAPSRRRGGRARHLPRTRGGRMSPRPSSDGFPRHLPDKVSSIQVQVQGRGRGAPSLPRSPLFFKIIAPKFPPGGTRQTPPPRPTGPRRSRLLPPARRLSPGPGAPARGHRRVWGLGEGGGAIRVRGSLPSPAVPAAHRAWSDGCSR